MSLKVMLAPGRYVQGPGALDQMGDQLEVLGIRNPLILASPSAKRAVGEAITGSLDAKGLSYAFIDFGGECTRKEIERIKSACLDGSHDAIINCGGGKVLDAGRAAATASALNVEKVPPEHIPDLGAGVPCVNVPTVAASDASTSSVSLVYSEDHVVEATMLFPASPTMVFVDTAVIAAAPVRLLVAGMGDALATYFEADMCTRTGSTAVVTRSHSTRAAQMLARLCFDLLMTYGVQATLEAEAKTAGPGLEAVVEANILLSGLGFESGGISGSHAVGHGFYHVAELFESPRFHGELVAYGTLTQLMLESRPPEFLDRIFAWCRAVGLPTTLEDLTLTDTSDAVVDRVAAAAACDAVLICSMAGASAAPDDRGRYYDQRVIFNAIKAVDVYGRALKARASG
jgi:glycerol dehydrogenase